MRRLGTISRGVAAARRWPSSRPRCGSDSNSSSDTTAAGAATTAAPAGSTATGGSEAPDVTTGVLKPVKLQLQWFTQAQFAGYFAALEKGFYRDEGLDVEILEGGVDIVPQTVLAQGNADFAIAWVPEGARSRASRAPASPTSRRSSSAPAPSRCRSKPTRSRIPRALKGKKVGNWGFGNEFELFAGMTKAGLEPGQRRHARPAAVRHAGAAQGRDRRRPGDDLQRVRPGARGQEPGHRRAVHARRTSTVINWNDVGTAMLQDAIWANTDEADSDAGVQGHRDQVRQGVRSRAGCTAGTTRRSASTSWWPRAPSWARATSCGR